MRYQLPLYTMFVLMLFPALAFAKAPSRGVSPIEKCLNVSTNNTKDCVNQYLKNKTLNKCYEMSESIFSYHSRENVRNFCFYSISEFPTLKTCTAAALRFFIAENKDQALFECFRQFNSQIDERTCHSIAKMMTFRDKRIYLQNHCGNL